MSVSVSPDQDQVYAALVAFITGIVPAGVKVLRYLPNRTALPPPRPGYAMIQALFTERLRFPIDTYTQGGNAPPTQYTVEQGIDIPFQVDFYGKHSGTWSATASTLFQDTYGCDALAPNCQPLYCNEGRMMPLTDEEKAYEERWSLDAHVQWNPVVTATQQYADQLELTLIDATVEFPT